MAAETDLWPDRSGRAPESPASPVDPPAEPATDPEQSLPDGYEPV